ncbi:MAG: dipeptide ABC transporter ATP-binding protein [Flavobacteriaceae bacterium]|nr:MAG: dipeptide ABC transporter ATP-binding protein [Flavobacteriaceae bacterium]
MLQINNLTISFFSNKVENTIVKNISFELGKNKISGMVGESGSGKSITSLAILRLLPKNTQVKGEIIFEGVDILKCHPKQILNIRGGKIGMVFQEPMSSLNPTLTCGYQVAEILKQHTNVSSERIKKEVIQLFAKVKLPQPGRIYTSYPHQISGGQKQRVMIAVAIACKPKLLIADEPTTALDVTVQKEILRLLKELQAETKMSILFISHDLELVSEIADTVIVMHNGTIVEQGNTKTIFKKPKENYTKALIASKLTLDKRFKILPTIRDFMEKSVKNRLYTNVERAKFHKKIYATPPVLEIINLEKQFISKASWFRKKSITKAVDAVSFKLYEGETLGLVGESGCGKTTLGKTILHLEKATSGHIFYKGKGITKMKKNALKSFRKEIQIIFQDPFSSLNPRMTVGSAIMEPMKVHKIFSNTKDRKAYVLELLQKVELTSSYFKRYPHELSGGQRQRISIARAIALQPKIIICDESVSALDVSVQAQVLNVLNNLKREFNFTYIFISHDLSVVKYMSDQLIVMNKGKIEEAGDADIIYKNPKTAYTKSLIEAIPRGI